MCVTGPRGTDSTGSGGVRRIWFGRFALGFRFLRLIKNNQATTRRTIGSTSSHSRTSNEGTEPDGRGSPAQEPLRLGGGVGSPAVPSRLTALDLDAFLFFCFAGTDGNKSSQAFCVKLAMTSTAIQMCQTETESLREILYVKAEMRWCPAERSRGKVRMNRIESTAQSGTPRWQEGSEMCEIWLHQWHIVLAVPKFRRNRHTWSHKWHNQSAVVYPRSKTARTKMTPADQYLGGKPRAKVK